jgi:hypothetical protein
LFYIAANFLPGMQVLFAGVPAANVSVNSSTRAEAAAPRLNVTGYINIKLMNADASWAVFEEALFYTEDCPFDGALTSICSC